MTTMHVTADLDLEIDGVRARIEADGDHVHVVSRQPLRLLRAAATGRSNVRNAAVIRAVDAAAAVGLTVSLDGPRRTVAVLRPGRRGRAQLVLLGQPLRTWLAVVTATIGYALVSSRSRSAARRVVAATTSGRAR